MRISYRRFTISPAGTVTDRASGREVGWVRPDGDGCWRGTAYLPGGRECPVGPWLTAYAAADALWLLAMAGEQVPA